MTSKRIWALLWGIMLVTLLTGCGGGGGNSQPGAPFDSGPETSRALPLGRGINMGNMLEAPNEGDWGETVHQEYFSIIKSKGFDTVRIPIRWSAHASTSSPYTIDAAFFTRVDNVIQWALDQNLNVVINVHHYQELLDNVNGQKTRFIEIWKQIANRYQSRSNKLYFELLNEPNGSQMTASVWNSLIEQTITAIRVIDTTHTVILGGVNWNSASGLNGLQIPAGETNVMVTFHFYSPMSFTHQGADWVSPPYPTGVLWPGGNVDAACQAIRSELQIAKTWSQNHGNIPVLLGEFGAFSAADMQSRVNWTSYVRKQTETMGFSWTYWEFCSGFGVYDKNAGAWRNELVSALGQ